MYELLTNKIFNNQY